MFQAVKSPFLVPFDGSFDLRKAPTAPDDDPGKKRARKELEASIERLRELQRMLYAQDRWSVLLVFQAMDAAGKDGTIRAVMSGINPAGCQVFSFKRPTPEELDHDFLWRTAIRLPERGRIGIFNRSYYEEVLVVRVHPEILDGQRLPVRPKGNRIWKERFESIADHEKHLARNGTAILKFWLNVSKREQRRRFVARIEEPEKNWKFESADVAERAHWDDYMRAFEEALNATSRPWAPWYAIPADDKPFMRAAVADVLVRALESLGLAYPTVSEEKRAELRAWGERLEDAE
ncbi:MAG: polyphosphate kinase 2 family protein [Gemmatimonadota bacterium]|jgi:PPK2 family polyphosphate:nucleotide phosphotransferase